MRIFRALPLVLICLIGCGGPSLVGKWNTKAPGAPAGSSMVTEFTGNTFKSTVDVSQAGVSLHIVINGDYTLEGKKLKMTAKSLDIDDSKLPAQYKAAMPTIKPMLEKEILKTEEGDLTIDGDTATFVNGKDTTTFTRIK